MTLRQTRPTVGLFVTCLADAFRPEVGFAAAALLERAGCEVAVPRQTCCGQPAYNAGDAKDAAALAKAVIAAFEGFDYVVVPSGSCAGMIKLHYPALFADDAPWRARAEGLAAKSYELLAFLAHVRRPESAPPRAEGRLAYHHSCSSLREMGLRDEPEALLAGTGADMKKLAEPETCCGFGGLFSVKFPDISARMADDKLDDAIRSGAQTLVSADLGCLLHLAGRAARRGDSIECRHAAEILAGTIAPAIGKASLGKDGA